jgi:hypothetical protein
MADQDLPLNVPPPGGTPPPTPPVPSPPPSPTRWVVVGAGALIAGALLTLWWMGRAAVDPTTLAPTGPTEGQIASRRPKPEPLELPPLSDTDALVRELAGVLSRHPLVARLAATRGVVRGLVLAVVQVGDGKTPIKPLAVLQPVTRVTMIDGPPGRIDPSSYTRWNGVTAALTSINAADAAQVYVNLKRRFDEAYAELGYPNGDFDEAIVKAIRTLDLTPDLPADVVVVRRPNYIEYEDPALRALLPVQKQFLLLGPDHRRAVTRWLHELARNLDLRID